MTVELELLEYCRNCSQGNEFNSVPCSSCLIIPEYIKQMKQDEIEYESMIDLKSH